MTLPGRSDTPEWLPGTRGAQIVSAPQRAELAKRVRVERCERDLERARARYRVAESRLMVLVAQGASLPRVQEARARAGELVRLVAAASAALAEARGGRALGARVSSRDRSSG